MFTRTGAACGPSRPNCCPPTETAYDWFGRSVALDGDTAVIGASGDDDNGEDSGSAYVFTRTAGVWTEQAKLLPSDGASDYSFGGSVALDGDTAVIGSTPEFGGSAYVFTRIGNVWTEQAKLGPLDCATVGGFGRSVALDGDTAVIASQGFDDNDTFVDSACVFTRVAGVWTGAGQPDGRRRSDRRQLRR